MNQECFDERDVVVLCPLSVYGFKTRPHSRDTFKQGFNLPPSSHPQKLTPSKLGWGL